MPRFKELLFEIDHSMDSLCFELEMKLIPLLLNGLCFLIQHLLSIIYMHIFKLIMLILLPRFFTLLCHLTFLLIAVFSLGSFEGGVCCGERHLLTSRMTV